MTALKDGKQILSRQTEEEDEITASGHLQRAKKVQMLFCSMDSQGALCQPDIVFWGKAKTKVIFKEKSKNKTLQHVFTD